MRNTLDNITQRKRRGGPAWLAVLLMIAGGCATNDPARMISRRCPVDMVDNRAEYLAAVKEGPNWKGGKVRVIGECFFDAQAIWSWAVSNGISCKIVWTDAEVGFRTIPNGHWSVMPEGSRYLVDYNLRLGVVRRAREPEREYVAVGRGTPLPETVARKVALKQSERAVSPAGIF